MRLLKAMLNRYVFSAHLNVSSISAPLMSGGSVFHSLGAATLKDLSAKVFLLVAGITSKRPSILLDLNPDLFGTSGLRRFLRYPGPH